MKRTGPSNPNLVNLARELKKKAIIDSSPFWKRLAVDLEKPARQRRAVNLSRINRFTKENETVVVPGKILGSGVLDHKVTVAAYAFSEGALEKLKKQNCTIMFIDDLLKKGVKPADVRILG